MISVLGSSYRTKESVNGSLRELPDAMGGTTSLERVG